jgi:hypothetical protein
MTISLINSAVRSRKGRPGKKKRKFAGSMAASINGGSLLQHCQIETIETSSSTSRGAQIAFGTGAHDSHKKEDSVHYLLMRMSFHFYGSIAMKPLA